MEPTDVDPYAPPKSALTGTDNTTYLDQDGYVFQNELVANQHFKSPLICAKLGIPIPPDSLSEPKKITVIRIPRIPKLLYAIINIVIYLFFFIFLFYSSSNSTFPYLIIYFVIARVIKRLITKPYKIPFYFSENYTRIRKRRVFIFTSLFLVLIAISTTGLITKNYQYASLGFPAAIITLIIFKFKTTYFIVTQTKGEFHYIRGVHRNLLDALPYLPISP